MNLSLRTKLLLLILPLLGILAFLFFTVLLPYQRVRNDIHSLRSDVVKTVALGDLGIALNRQLAEYYKMIMLGGAEDKFQAASRDAQESLRQWRNELAAQPKSEEVDEANHTLEEIARDYDDLNRISQIGIDLAKNGHQEQATALIETQVERAGDSLLLKAEQLDLENEIRFDEKLARLNGHTDDLISFTQGDLKKQSKNMKGHVTDTFLVFRLARSFNEQMQEYYFLIAAKKGNEAAIAGPRQEAARALAAWKINEGGGVGIRTTANKDLEDVERVEAELAKLNQLGNDIPDMARKGEKAQALRLLTDQIEPIAHGQLASLLDESVKHEGKALGESLDGVSKSSSQMQFGLGMFSLLVLIIGLGTPWLLSKTIISPILDLKKAAARVGSGDLETKVKVTSKGELSELGTTFNRMTEALKEGRDSLNEANRELEQKVADRTVALKTSNEQLQIELNERERTHLLIEAALREKEMLLKEVHHRVKNNLQVISSLLNLQGKQIKDEQARMIFQDSQNRVKSMALIHESLYQTDDLAHIDFADYVHKLIDSISRSYQFGSGAIQMKVNVGDIALGVDRAVPCGLIINELISNSLKHAFPAGAAGEIRIDLSADGDTYKLILSDDGIGFPKGLDLEGARTLGLKLVKTLTEQLQGELICTNGSGTMFEITFPSEPVKENS